MSVQKKVLQDILLRQVDATLTPWRQAALPVAPPSGWIRAIREALGMTATALAKMLDMTSAGVGKLEKNEAQERITLATLRKVADALDCDVRYALVPRQPLEAQRMARARQVVAAQMRPVAHSMVLESQGVEDQAAMDKYLDAAARRLMAQSPRDLW